MKQEKEEPVVKITFKRLLAYFAVYSFLGFIVETIFGILTKGVLESRQSCLFGPFCCIYGIGAAIMIPGLQPFKKSNWAVFFVGAVEGSVIEYVISWIGEVIFQIKWWDYSNMPFNINGRITLTYTVFWGLLALCLVRFINPYIETGINKLPKKWFNILTIGFTIFLLLDLLITALGLKVFYTRLIKEHNLEVKDSQILMVSDEVMDNKIIKAFSKTIFSELNLATSNNSLIKYSNLYDLSSAMSIYLFLCSCGISFISLNNDKYPIIDVNGVFMSCARYTINSSFFCSFSLASLSFFIDSVLK